MKKYPGAIFYKLSTWEKLKMWFWGIKYGRKNVVNFFSIIEKDQQILDRFYNMCIDNKIKREFPPIKLTNSK